MAESFFSSLKKERMKNRICKTRDMANAEIYDDIERFYNRTRRQSHLSGVSPEAFEQCRQGLNGVRKSPGSPPFPLLELRFLTRKLSLTEKLTGQLRHYRITP